MIRYKLIRTPFEDLIIGNVYIMSLKTGILISKNDDFLTFISEFNNNVWNVPITTFHEGKLVHYKKKGVIFGR